MCAVLGMTSCNADFQQFKCRHVFQEREKQFRIVFFQIGLAACRCREVGRRTAFRYQRIRRCECIVFTIFHTEREAGSAAWQFEQIATQAALEVGRGVALGIHQRVGNVVHGGGDFCGRQHTTRSCARHLITQTGVWTTEDVERYATDDTGGIRCTAINAVGADVVTRLTQGITQIEQVDVVVTGAVVLTIITLSHHFPVDCVITQFEATFQTQLQAESVVIEMVGTRTGNRHTVAGGIDVHTERVEQVGAGNREAPLRAVGAAIGDGEWHFSQLLCRSTLGVVGTNPTAQGIGEIKTRVTTDVGALGRLLQIVDRCKVVTVSILEAVIITRCRQGAACSGGGAGNRRARRMIKRVVAIGNQPTTDNGKVAVLT